jgi:uncharacterized membrane protein YphA (DoxX/SURF4 family)
MTRKTLLGIIVFMFILLFVYAAMSKLLDYERFALQIKSSPIIGPYSGLLAWAVPAIEIIIVTLLCAPKTRAIGLNAAFGLMLLFTMYISFILLFSGNIPCSCGGILESLGWVEHLIFNFAFVLLAAMGVGLHRRVNNLQPTLAKDSSV